VAIDRSRLAEPESTALPAPRTRTVPSGVTRVVLTWPYYSSQSTLKPIPVPEVAGRPVREAVLALHRRGFRVALRGLGRVSRTVPAAGQPAMPGTAVTVWAQ
jgi:hypothetical protein